MKSDAKKSNAHLLLNITYSLLKMFNILIKKNFNLPPCLASHRLGIFLFIFPLCMLIHRLFSESLHTVLSFDCLYFMWPVFCQIFGLLINFVFINNDVQSSLVNKYLGTLLLSKDRM